MSPEDHLKAGDPDAALTALQALVRVKPADAKLRIFLFQLLCVLGDWKRAITQLKVCGELDPLSIPMTQTYREAIICEVYREKVFAGQKDPLVFGEPQPWLGWLIEAMRTEDPVRAAELRAAAFDAAPATPGRRSTDDGVTAFDWIADADMRLGPVLEVVVNGRYFWLPFGTIRKIEIEPPTDLRDLVWTAATLTLENDGQVVGLIPSRYAGTTPGGTAAQRMARATDWAEPQPGLYTGLGARLLTTEAGDVPLFQAGTLAFGPPGEA